MFKALAAHLSPRLWLAAAAGSVALLLVVFSQLDYQLIRNAVGEMQGWWFLFAVVLLLIEGLATTQRMRDFTPGPPSYAACLKVSAWFVVYLVILPARLGELVAVWLLRTHAGQKTGPAMASLVTQRLFDLLLLGAIFVLMALLVSGLPIGLVALAGALLTVGLLAALIVWLEPLLSLIARLLQALRARRPARWLKALLRLVLQARHWRRHHASHHVLLRGLAATFAKWLFNLGGLSALLIALQVPLSIEQALLVSAAFNFLAVIPLQTIGGIGLSEVGLAALLMVFGSSVEYAASLSVVVRAVLLITPFCYWLLVMSLLRLRQASA